MYSDILLAKLSLFFKNSVLSTPIAGRTLSATIVTRVFTGISEIGNTSPSKAFTRPEITHSPSVGYSTPRMLDAFEYPSAKSEAANATVSTWPTIGIICKTFCAPSFAAFFVACSAASSAISSAMLGKIF